MNNLPESSVNLIISGVMGILGGLFTIPINAFFAYSLKRDEIEFSHRLDEISKKRELLLQHKLELSRIEFTQKIEKAAQISEKG